MKSKQMCIGCILTALFCGPAANAAVIMTLEQVGPNVVATGSGTVDLAGLTSSGSGNSSAFVQSDEAILVQGNAGVADIYNSISGPINFGSGNLLFASSGTGDLLFIFGFTGTIAVPHGYVSGSPLSSTATFDSQTLATLGVATGTYTWTWGSGATADSATLYAGVPVPSSVPEPASALLLTLGAAGFALLPRIRK